MASNSNFSGLNVATKAGEGYAHINHWENFYNTVNSIHQEDLTNQKMIRDAVAKSSLEVAEAQKGIRAIEIPKFKEAADKFTNAALVAASPDVQKNPKLLAQWTQKKNDAYMEAITIAEGSKAAVKRKNDIVNDIFKAKGVGFKSQEELNPIFNEYDNLSLIHI